MKLGVKMAGLNCAIIFLTVQHWYVKAHNGVNLAGNQQCKSAYCNLQKCFVDCNGLNLNLLPTPQMVHVNSSFVTKLTLKDNRIKSLPEAGFAHFTKLRILDLSENPLEYCRNSSFMGLNSLVELYLRGFDHHETGFLRFESGVFSPLTSIKYVDFSLSSIDMAALFKASCSLSEGIETILMDDIFTHHVIKNIDMPCFHRLKVKKISIDHSNIGHVASNFIFNIKSVEYLSTRQNRMDVYTNYWFLLTMFNLTYIDVSCQFEDTCDNNYPWSKWLPNFPELYKYNRTTVPTSTKYSATKLSNNSYIYFYIFPNLHTVLARHTFIRIYIKKTKITRYVPCWENNQLLNLDLSFISELYAPYLIPCFNNLKFLNLRGVKRLTVGVETFRDMSSLEILMLGSAGIPEGTFTEHNSAVFFVKNKELRFLDLSNLRLTTLHKDIFKGLNKLESLILSHNKLTNVQGLDVNLPSIQNIDLSNNKMRDIPSMIIANVEKSDNFNLLHLNNNPFICGCPDIYKLDQVFHSKIRIPGAHDRKGTLRCTLANNKNVPFIEAYDILRSKCISTSFIFLIVVYPLTISAILLGVCCFRYRWKMKYACFNFHWYLSGRNVNDENAEFHFDAFVAYSGKDEEWVRTNLIKTLENRNPSYSLCIHDRNFMPGEYIADNIILAISKSKKTILVISKRFVKSGWCDFESRMAQIHHLGKTNNRIIVIMFPGVYKYALKKDSLKALLNMVTFLEWPREQEGQRLFRLRLCTALGKPLGIQTGDDDYILQPVSAS